MTCNAHRSMFCKKLQKYFLSVFQSTVTVHSLQSTVLQSTVHISSVDGLQFCIPQSTVYSLQSTVHQVQHYQLQTAYCPLLDCLLITALPDYLPPDCPTVRLPTAYCPTAYCQLITGISQDFESCNQ